MDQLTTEGFVNKRDAAELFNRSHRSLSRDITTSVKLRDVDYLQNFRLQTLDGQVREGTEVTIEILDTLRDAGQVPTWWADPEFLAHKYGRRGEDPTDAAPSTTALLEEVKVSDDSPATMPEAAPPVPASDSGGSVVVGLLKQQIDDLKQDKQHLQRELERSYELRKEDNDLREQNNKLMTQLYGLLASMQEAPGNTYVLNQGAAEQQAKAKPTPTVAIDAPAVASESPVRPKSQSQKRTSQSTTRSRPKRKTASQPKKSAKKTPKSSRPKKQPTATDKYLPTFSRLFGRSK